MPKISVIIPVYNGRNTLKAAIESVLSQTFTDYEIIIVDDASTDGSFNVGVSYAEKYDNITIVKNDENRFVGYTRNRALSMAKGEYVFFLDCDDILYSTGVFKNAMVLAYEGEAAGADIVVSSVRVTAIGGKKKGKIASAADILLFSPYLSQSFYKRKIIKRPFDERRKTAEDCEWLFYNLPIAKSIKAAPFPFYIYTVGRKDSLTTDMPSEYIAPTAETFIAMYKAENSFPKRDKNKIKRYCANSLIACAIRAQKRGLNDIVKMCVPYLKKSKAAPFILLSHIIGIKAALGLINLKMKVE